MESMEQNVGTIDRLVRAGIAIVVLIFLVKSGKISLISALALLGSGVLLSSSISGICPLYTELDITTTKNG